MVAEKSEGNTYIITNVSKHLTQLQLAAALRRSPLKWSVRPETTPDRRNATYNVHKVFALTPPTKTCVRLNDADTGTSSLARIVPSVDTFKNKKRGFGGMAELNSSDVGILREWLQADNHCGNWADASEEEDDLGGTDHWEMDCDDSEQDPNDPDSHCRRQVKQSKIDEASARKERAAELRSARLNTNGTSWQNREADLQQQQQEQQQQRQQQQQQQQQQRWHQRQQQQHQPQQTAETAWIAHGERIAATARETQRAADEISKARHGERRRASSRARSLKKQGAVPRGRALAKDHAVSSVRNETGLIHELLIVHNAQALHSCLLGLPTCHPTSRTQQRLGQPRQVQLQQRQRRKKNASRRKPPRLQ